MVTKLKNLLPNDITNSEIKKELSETQKRIGEPLETKRAIRKALHLEGINLKVGIVGFGEVGAHLASTLLQQQYVSKIGLYNGKKFDDISFQRYHDLMDSMPQSHSLIGYKKSPPTIRRFDCLDDMKKDNFDVYVICIKQGYSQREYMNYPDPRLPLLEWEAEPMKALAEKFRDVNSRFIIVTNPMDIITYLFWKYYTKGMSKEEAEEKKRDIVGYGSMLDGVRLRNIIHGVYNQITKKNIEFYDVDATVIGQHGPYVVPLLNKARIKDQLITEIPEIAPMTDDIVKKVIKSGPDIVKALDHTTFGPAGGIRELIETMFCKVMGIQIASSFGVGPRNGSFEDYPIGRFTMFKKGRIYETYFQFEEMTTEQIAQLGRGYDSIRDVILDYEKRGVF